MKKIFVDGITGTTGLKIHERLSLYDNIELIQIDYEKRRDPAERARCLNAADVVFLCLPDDAAKEAVSLIKSPDTKVIDASTAHRVHPDWAYGIPELSMDHRNRIRNSKRVTNPGCYATSFVLAIYPLVKQGFISVDSLLTCHGVSGYSGAGKAMIDKCQANDGKNPYTKAPRPYGLTLNHKHLPEMQMRTGLTKAPIFTPIVAQNNQGMIVSVPLHLGQLAKTVTAKEIHEFLSEFYKNELFIKMMPYNDEASLYEGAIDIEDCNDTNRADIYVYGNEEKNTALLITRLDNLGKGASGAAIQNMNIMLGFEEGLHLLVE